MRRTIALLLLVAGMLGLVLSCSEKSKPALTAPPANPVCELSASALSFGSVAVGASADRSFTLTNTGDGTLAGSITESSADFAVTGSSSFSLGAGQAATITVRFSPTSAGDKTCTLSTGASQCGTVVATGTGEDQPPVCFVQTTSLDFGTLNYGGTARRTIAIQNTGGGTLTGSIAGATVDFRLLDPPTFSLGAGQWANIEVQFSPSKGGTQACTLAVDPPGCAPIVCRGYGNLAVHDHCSISATSGIVDFGDVSIGFTAQRSFTLKNFDQTYIGRGCVTEQCPEFELAGLACYDLSPGGTFLGDIRFTPTRPGPQECAIPVGCWMDGSGTNPGVQNYVICRGVGVGGSPQCQLSTTTLAFGQVVVGQTKDLPIQITNVGTGILSGTVGPSHCTQFSFVGATSYGLGANQTATLTVRYTPSQVGHTTTCSLVPTGLGCDPVTFVGEAVGPPQCDVSATSLDFGSVPVGQSRDLTFDVENAGGGTLCGAVTETCSDFAIVQNSSYCITPPAFVRITVRFTPSATGSQQCTISAGAGCATVAVTGVGS